VSRAGDDYEGDSFPNESALWHANAERALRGKRGRKALADLRDALLALPARRLIEGALCTVNPDRRRPSDTHRFAGAEFDDLIGRQGEGVCAVGALLWHRRVKDGMDPAEAFDSLPTLPDSDSDLHDTASLAAREAKLVYSLAWNLAWRNDETYGRMTPEERYTAFLAWINAELAGGALMDSGSPS